MILSIIVLLTWFKMVVSVDYWQPNGNYTWDYHLLNVPNNYSDDVVVYDIDGLDAGAEIISDLHQSDKFVICYFSAGSYENWRHDAHDFNDTDLGEPLDGWEGERWINISSPNVRDIMTKRIEIAKNKNCDAIDPDNIDGYDNDNGLNLTQEDSINYMKFLSNVTHNFGMSIGLKNGGAIVHHVIDFVDFSVQEQCIQYGECDLYHDFLLQNKSIFHIEYPKGDNVNNFDDLTGKTIDKYCNNTSAHGFSTILKNIILDSWLIECSNDEVVLDNVPITNGNSSTFISSSTADSRPDRFSSTSSSSKSSSSSNYGDVVNYSSLLTFVNILTWMV